MSSPIIFGGNNVASNLQNAMRMATGKLITDNGPYNLIPYAQFENGLTTGWSLGTATLTSNFPSGAPTFGSGASGNLTLTATSSSPILGTYSLLYQSSAATTAGNFVASDQFSIPFEMQGKVLSFRIPYNCSGNPANANFSGTSSNSYGVAFWDATNSTWIQPAGVFNLVQNSGVGIATGTLQPPTTCLAGRLVIYNANATAGAMSMLFDDFYLGLQTTSQGPAMTDWAAYTPTFTGLGTVSGTEFYSRRVGDTLQVRGYVVCGVTTATEMRVSLGYAGGNSNVTTQALTNRAIAGHALCNTTGAQTLDVIMESGVSYMTFGIANSGNSGYSKMNGSTFLSNGSVLTLFAAFPIAGWSSNTVQSADTATNVVAFNANTPSGTLGAAYNQISWLAINDSSGSWTTNVYKVPVSGWYQINAAISIAGTFSAGNNTEIVLRVNGVDRADHDQRASGAQVWATPNLVTLQYLNAGDLLTFFAYTDGTSPTYVSTQIYQRLSIFRLSGPAVVQATDTVAARYESTSTGTLNSLRINWDTKTYDYTNSVTTGASWVFTAPVSGLYSVAAKILTSTNTAAQNVTLDLYKNGILYSNFGRTDKSDTGSGRIPCSAYDEVKLNAGETVYVVGSSSSGTLTLEGSASINHMVIKRIGN